MDTKNIVILVLAVLVAGLLYVNYGSAPSIDKVAASEVALAYINDVMLQGQTTATIEGDVVEERGLYKFEIKIGDEQFPSYITKDGKLLFPQGIELDDVEVSDTGDVAPPVSDVNYDETNYFRGEDQAPVTIIDFSDIQCPFCSRFHDTMKEVMENYPTEVKWVYRHFPLDSIHPYAREAAEATECAGEQGSFWTYTDALYENQSSIKPSYFSELAGELSLDVTLFDACMDEDRYTDKVEADYQAGLAAGVSGTPGGFINGVSIGGAVPFSTLKGMIDNILNKE